MSEPTWDNFADFELRPDTAAARVTLTHGEMVWNLSAMPTIKDAKQRDVPGRSIGHEPRPEPAIGAVSARMAAPVDLF